jgi:hypothetical protein
MMANSNQVTGQRRSSEARVRQVTASSFRAAERSNGGRNKLPMFETPRRACSVEAAILHQPVPTKLPFIPPPLPRSGSGGDEEGGWGTGSSAKSGALPSKLGRGPKSAFESIAPKLGGCFGSHC